MFQAEIEVATTSMGISKRPDAGDHEWLDDRTCRRSCRKEGNGDSHGHID